MRAKEADSGQGRLANCGYAPKSGNADIYPISKFSGSMNKVSAHLASREREKRSTTKSAFEAILLSKGTLNTKQIGIFPGRTKATSIY